MVEGRWVKAGLIYGIVWLTLSNACFAANTAGVSVGMFGVGVRMMVAPQIPAEIRYSLDQDFHTLTGRAYYNLLKKSTSFVPFVGVGYGTVNFNIEDIQGNGTIISAFVGSEFFVSKNLSVGLDIGYENVTLSALGFTVSGGEIVCGTGLNYYFSLETETQTVVVSSFSSTTAIQLPVSAVEVSSPTITPPTPPQPVASSPSQTQSIATSSESVKSMDTNPKPAAKPLTKEEKEMVTFFFESGKRLYLAKDYSGAMEQFQQVLKYYPMHPESLKYIGLCEQELKKR